MQVICLEDEAFYALVEKVLSRIKEQYGTKGDKWISDCMTSKERRLFVASVELI